MVLANYPEMGTKAYEPWKDPTALKEASGEFGIALREVRTAVKPFLSQRRLAEAADFDHSYISRLESGARMPTADAVERIATALGLNERQRDKLKMAAGFMPTDPTVMVSPMLARLASAMANASPQAEADAEAVISALTRILERDTERGHI